jgi:hypothetical protein
MSNEINYENCPLTVPNVPGIERQAVLVPHDEYLMRIVAVTDAHGTFPGAGYYSLCDGCWIYRSTTHSCPPGREDVVREFINGWSRRGIRILARWCSQNASAIAMEAHTARAAYAADAADTDARAANAANAAANAAISAAHAARFRVEQK